MSSDSSATRPGAGGLRPGAGPDKAGRADRADATDPALKPTSSASGRSAVKDPPTQTYSTDRQTSAAADSQPGATTGSRSGSGKPTEVYDQVRRQWVTVGGPPDLEPAAAAAAEPGAVVTAAQQPVARRARLVLRTVDPWSVMKLSFVLSLAGAIILLVTVWLMWLLLSNGGVFVSVDKTVGDIAGSTTSVSVLDIFSLRRVMGVALMLAVVQVVLVTALATLVAFLYNLASGLVGGLDITLSEER